MDSIRKEILEDADLAQMAEERREEGRKKRRLHLRRNIEQCSEEDLGSAAASAARGTLASKGR